MTGIYRGNIEESKRPIQYKDIQFQLQHDSRYVKYITIGEDRAQKAFERNILAYFPAYRYELPGYLNDIFRIELQHKFISRTNGYFINPIEVVSDLPGIANWMMDVAFDSNQYEGYDREILTGINKIISTILMNKHKKDVRIGIGSRNMGGARIQIVESQTAQMIYPTIFNMSAGEASLLCIFGELLRQTDRLGKQNVEVEGIVLIDEVDKHLHIVLQKEVIPKLIQMFPKIQFILTTHSIYLNMGLTDEIRSDESIIDLDNGGIKSELGKSIVFREAYDAMIKENERYAYFFSSLSDKVKSITKPVVYLEGRTDEKYFKKAYEVFGYKDDIDFQWIGHLDKNGNEEFTGHKSLDQGLQFIKGRNPKILHFFLFDCDTEKQESDEGNIVVLKMPRYHEHVIMNKGIENALELEDINIESFYGKHTQPKDYGNSVTTRELNKMKMCEFICDSDIDTLKKILRNLKSIIDKIIERANRK